MKYMIIFVVALALLCVVYSFIEWNAQISTWSIDSRFVLILIASGAAITAWISDTLT